jgi:hypothetical protein
MVPASADGGVRSHLRVSAAFRVNSHDVVKRVALQIAEDASAARAKRILDIADAAERGEVKVTWLTGLSKEEQRERLFRKMPRS